MGIEVVSVTDRTTASFWSSVSPSNSVVTIIISMLCNCVICCCVLQAACETEIYSDPDPHAVLESVL